MIPKNHKQFIKSTAEDTNQKEVLVSDVVGFYYSALRKSLTDVQSINIKVECLGTFKVKERQLVKLKCKLEDHLKRLENPETFSQMKIKKEIEEKYENLSRVASLLVSEKVRHKLHKEKRNGKTEGDLEE